MNAAGTLLSRLHADLPGFECRRIDAAAAEFSCADRGLTFRVDEVVESHFLMHVVVAQFTFAIPTTLGGTARIRVSHTGALVRRGVEFIGAAENQAVVSSLRTDATLIAALMPLDFTHCEIVRDCAGWRVRLQHFGASEVVGRVPMLRRYVPLAAAQRDALLATFAAADRVLRQYAL
jgi:hypothetical protein